MLKIKRPNNLIKGKFLTSRGYCAVGWLARAVDISDDTLEREFAPSIVCNIKEELNKYSIKVSEREIFDLLHSNDLVKNSTDRIHNFVYWCENNGIEVD